VDFTLKQLKKLYLALLNKYDLVISFGDYLNCLNTIKHKQIVILRHDVDRNPENSLKVAKLEETIGIKSTYFFRVVPESYNLNIMNKIADLGHEIGYHYEDIDLIYSKFNNKEKEKLNKNKLIELAYHSFCENLDKLRSDFNIKTICMHGSPKSKFDNKLIWSKYNYKDLDIIGEPYLDIDFNKVAYFTDTGRRWDGYKFSIRDKVDSGYKMEFKSTFSIINNIDGLPNKVMFTIHPERWHESKILWLYELVIQNCKNILKRIIIKYNLLK